MEPLVQNQDFLTVCLHYVILRALEYIAGTDSCKPSRPEPLDNHLSCYATINAVYNQCSGCATFVMIKALRHELVTKHEANTCLVLPKATGDRCAHLSYTVSNQN
jgi:hypothetical protein